MSVLRPVMHKAGTISLIHGLYRSECCGVECPVPINETFPPCPGSGTGKSRCSGRNAEWILVRPT